MKIDEESLRKKFIALRERLEKICTEKGHDFSVESKNVGNHVENYTVSTCEHVHYCTCPTEQRTHSVNDFVTIRQCRRCGKVEVR